MDKTSFFLFNIIVNSLLTFLTAVILVESLIFCLRIRQGRAAALLRMMPILKLPLDLWLYDFSKWSYTHHLTPVNCAEGTRELSIIAGYMPSWLEIRLTMPGEMTFTLADVIGHYLGLPFIKALVAVFAVLSTYFFIKTIKSYLQANREFQLLEKDMQHDSRKALKIYRMPITGSPFVTGFFKSRIYMPSKLVSELTSQEYEAILAHEIEHVRNRDNLVRFALELIRSLFWWIPTRGQIKRIEEGQEVACDRASLKSGVDPLDLSSAVYKAAKFSTYTNQPVFSHTFTRHDVHNRIERLLSAKPARFEKLSLALSLLTIVLAFIGVLTARLWIF